MPLRLRGFSLAEVLAPKVSRADLSRFGPCPLPRRRPAFTLAEIILSLGILCIAILAVAPLAVHLQRSLYQGDTADATLFLAGSHVLEEARAHVQKSEDGFASLRQTFDGRTFNFDADGIPVKSGKGEITCSAVAAPDPAFPAGGNHLLRMAVKAWYSGSPDRTVELATLLAPSPPAEHVVFSGFLKGAEDGRYHWDDYWGGYYGALYGKKQGEAYKAGLIEVDVFPLPAEPTGEATPPAAPTPLPWGWR